MLFLSTSSRVDLIIINLSRLLYFVTRFSLFFVVNYGWEHETHSSSAIVGLLLKIQKSISFLPNTRIHPGNFSGKKAARVGKKETEYRALRWTKVNGGDDDGLPDRTNHRPEEDASLLKRAGPAAAAARDHRWMDGWWMDMHTSKYCNSKIGGALRSWVRIADVGCSGRALGDFNERRPAKRRWRRGKLSTAEYSLAAAAAEGSARDT